MEDKQPKENNPVKKERSAWWLQLRAALPGMLKRVPGHLARWGKENFAMEPRRLLALFQERVFFKNPTLVLLLGICSTLAVSTSLQNAVGMGAAVTAVLTCSNLLISLLRTAIPPRVRTLCCIGIIAGFTTLADLYLRAFFPALSADLGIFVPLIAVNCAVLTRAEPFAAGHKPGYALADGVATGIGYAAVLIVLGGARELLGAGALFGMPLLGAGYQPTALMLLPCGGFLLLGVMTAYVQWLRARPRRKKGEGGDQA